MDMFSHESDNICLQIAGSLILSVLYHPLYSPYKRLQKSVNEANEFSKQKYPSLYYIRQ